jgi:hypothetical protein
VTREYQRGYQQGDHLYIFPGPDQQTAICTNDAQCQAAADEHNPDCPIEQSLQDEFGGF